MAEKWWNFRTHFGDFINDIREQVMMYEKNLRDLLNDIITDESELLALMHNPSDESRTSISA